MQHDWHIALQGAQNKPVVADKLVSPFALLNLAVTIVENFVGWLCVWHFDSDVNVPTWYFKMCGALMMGLMIVTLRLTYESSKRLAAKEVNGFVLLTLLYKACTHLFTRLLFAGGQLQGSWFHAHSRLQRYAHVCEIVQMRTIVTLTVAALLLKRMP